MAVKNVPRSRAGYPIGSSFLRAVAESVTAHIDMGRLTLFVDYTQIVPHLTQQYLVALLVDLEISCPSDDNGVHIN